ncbi:hypothetical protein [Modestobacter excelsi]|uniref:hypothetical protein n=1 Tax=Modestobacter excelsi TaxID=2213161 RepID=UPI00110CB942|nr:hypothetical protein [Modestobacter excelsi]
MTSDERHRRMDAARVRAELTMQELWLRYVALGGTGDAFDLDGYLQALVPLEVFQQDVLAQALNEALEESYLRYCIPLSTPPAGGTGDDRLRRLVDTLLEDQVATFRDRLQPPTADPPEADAAP